MKYFSTISSNFLSINFVKCTMISLICCLCIIQGHSQGHYQLSLGLHSTDFSDIKGISEDWSLDNKSLNYHATIGYVVDIPLIFVETNIGLDIDRYQINQVDFNQYKLIAPLQAGIKLGFIEMKTGIMGRYIINKDDKLNDIIDSPRISLQYFNGLGVRFGNIGITLNYASSSPYIFNTIFNREINVDNNLEDRIFLTAKFCFGSKNND